MKYDPNLSQESRLDFLIDVLQQESNQYNKIRVGGEERRRTLRSLMNVRMPAPISQEFLRIQDVFLKQEAMEKSIVTLPMIPTIASKYDISDEDADRISIWQGDITRLQVDGIVNAANAQLLGCFYPCHGCIDNAIHSAAGIQLREECHRIMVAQGHEEATGSAKITKAYNLPCKHVLHTVGPIIRGELTDADCQLLQSCYESCLELAEEKGLESIAFCCISTGEFHFPNDKAAEIAVQTVKKYLKQHQGIKRVIFNVFKDSDLEEYKSQLVK